MEILSGCSQTDELICNCHSKCLLELVSLHKSSFFLRLALQFFSNCHYYFIEVFY